MARTSPRWLVPRPYAVVAIATRREPERKLWRQRYRLAMVWRKAVGFPALIFGEVDVWEFEAEQEANGGDGGGEYE